jgi:hypothetical protein
MHLAPSGDVVAEAAVEDDDRTAAAEAIQVQTPVIADSDKLVRVTVCLPG